MKTLLITFIVLLFASTSFGRSIRSLLKKEQAFRSNEFYMLAVPLSEEATKAPDFSRRFSNDEEGFLYLNIPDSIVLINIEGGEKMMAYEFVNPVRIK